MDDIDLTRCPICQSPNACAMEMARAAGTKPERCWSMDSVFTPKVLALLPDKARGKACICAKCVKSVGVQQY